MKLQKLDNGSSMYYPNPNHSDKGISAMYIFGPVPILMLNNSSDLVPIKVQVRLKKLIVYWCFACVHTKKIIFPRNLFFPLQCRVLICPELIYTSVHSSLLHVHCGWNVHMTHIKLVHVCMFEILLIHKYMFSCHV